MFEKNSYVIYKRDVCKIKDIIMKDKEYYVLVPLSDESLTINLPTSNENDIRKIISKKEVEELIEKIPTIEIISCENDKLLEQEYKRLISLYDHESLIKIIKTTYVRNKNRLENKRKIGEKDSTYFKKAENMLYTEFSIALNKTYEETEEYVKNKVEKSINDN